MNQRFALKSAAIAVAIVAAATASADDVDFKMHGYFRSGINMTKDGARGNDLALLSSLGSAHFRLGNEQNSKFEFIPELKIRNGDGAVATIHANLTHETKCTADWNCVDGDGHELQVREGYAQVENLLIAPSAVFWAGKRYSSSNASSHMYDWEYIQYNGTGGGVDKIDLGFARMDVGVYAFNPNDDKDKNANNVNGGDLRDQNKQGYGEDYSLNTWLKGIGGSAFDLQLVAHSRKQTNDRDLYAATRGVGVAGVYNLKGFYYLGEGYSKVALQVGKGLGAGDSLGKNGWGWANLNGTKSVRLALDGMYQNGSLDIATFAFYQKDKNYRGWSSCWDANCSGNPGATGWDRKLYAVGIRPYHQLTRNFAMQYELGYEHASEQNKKGGMVKATIAPTLTMGQGFWTRPVIRTYVTYAKWDKEVSGRIDQGYTRSGKTSAVNVGVTAEAWF